MPAGILSELKAKYMDFSDEYDLGAEKAAISTFFSVCLEHLVLASTRGRFESINHTKLMTLTSLEVMPSTQELSNYEASLAHYLGKGMIPLANSLVDDILSMKSADYYKKYPEHGPFHSGNTFKLYSQGVVFELLELVEYLDSKLPYRQEHHTEKDAKSRYFQDINHETERIASSLDNGILGKFKEYNGISNYLRYVLTGSLNTDIKDAVH